MSSSRATVGGVSQMLTIADEGGGGVTQKLTREFGLTILITNGL